jgi:predicted HAD superfamily Cof-like phosphohydrolase
MNQMKKTGEWFVATGQMPEALKPDVRQTAFYLGMQIEELAEKIRAVYDDAVCTSMDSLANILKSGGLDADVHAALTDPARAQELLDGDCDVLWVTLGAARAMGSDIDGAYAEVNHKNWDKRFEDGTFHRAPDTGKVLKRPGWTPPDLTPFLHPSLRGAE